MGKGKTIEERRKIDELAAKHIEAVKDVVGADRHTLKLVEIAFKCGALAIADHLREFVERKTSGVRDGVFSKGVDEGLFWTLQEVTDFMEGL